MDYKKTAQSTRRDEKRVSIDKEDFSLRSNSIIERAINIFDVTTHTASLYMTFICDGWRKIEKRKCGGCKPDAHPFFEYSPLPYFLGKGG